MVPAVQDIAPRNIQLRLRSLGYSAVFAPNRISREVTTSSRRLSGQCATFCGPLDFLNFEHLRESKLLGPRLLSGPRNNTFRGSWHPLGTSISVVESHSLSVIPGSALHFSGPSAFTSIKPLRLFRNQLRVSGLAQHYVSQLWPNNSHCTLRGSGHSPTG